jgi:hypothetical protein
MKIGHPKNFWGGVMFIMIGLIFAVIAYGVPGVSFMPGYTMGTPARMGPGFFPFYLGMILATLGVLIAFTGLRVHPGDPGIIEKFHWGPLSWVLGAIVIFGLLLKPVGVLLDGILLIVIASLGSHEFKLKSVLILAVCLTVFCAMVFVWGLKLPIPLCPDIESLQSAVAMCRG